MKRIALALAALLSIAASKPVDWTRNVTRTPDGAHVLGNPKAKVRLTEYLSYSCVHCAHFSGAAGAALRTGYVAKGTTAVEFRNAVRDRFDYTAAVLARCGGAGRFFGDSEAIFAAHDALMAKAAAYEAGNAVPETAPVDDALKAMARGSGLIELMTKRGYTPARLDACLTSKPIQDAVLAMTTEAWQTRKIPYTPFFLINGKPSEPGGWAEIEPQLRAALAAR